MLPQAAWATLWLLLFRAGPQDFPHSPPLARTLMLLAALANFLVFRLVMPPLLAGVMAAALVAAFGLVTQSLLKARGHANRFDQTFNALLATNAVLTLAMLPSFAQIAPVLQQVAGEPGLLSKPLQVPQAPVWIMNALNLWNFAVSASIFRHAAGVNLGLGALIAIVITFVVMFIVVFVGTLAAALL